jgi:hypothetical protein
MSSSNKENVVRIGGSRDLGLGEGVVNNLEDGFANEFSCPTASCADGLSKELLPSMPGMGFNPSILDGGISAR